MNSCVSVTSAEAIEGLLQLINPCGAIIDVTYGNGTFWNKSTRQVLGGDIDPNRAPHFVADFRCLPFANNSIPVVVFDPPFHPFVKSAEEQRFSGMGKNDVELKTIFQTATKECWRVTKEYLILKCQGFVHNHKPQWMPLWATSICGEPFEWLFVWRSGKRVSGRWTREKSLRRNHAEYLLFSKAGNLR